MERIQEDLQSTMDQAEMDLSFHETEIPQQHQPCLAWGKALVIARIAAAFHRIRPGSGCPCAPRRDWPERLSVRIEACRLPGLDCLLETGARNGLRGRRCRTALC